VRRRASPRYLACLRRKPEVSEISETAIDHHPGVAFPTPDAAFPTPNAASTTPFHPHPQIVLISPFLPAAVAERAKRRRAFTAGRWPRLRDRFFPSGPRSDNTSGFLGVSWDKRSQKWRAQISIDGRNRVLGAFATPEQANEAYQIAAAVRSG
jgi:hypothetical protein